MTSSLRKEYHVAYCGGRACPVCHKCSDWYYNSYDHKDCDHGPRVYDGHLGPLVGPLYRWQRRLNATCGYHSYPHYVYYAAYHGNCPYGLCCTFSFPPSTSSHVHHYPNPAIHGPYLCHCTAKE